MPKPEPAAFDRMVARHGVRPQAAAMFEDMPMNLEAPHLLGMTTVLVHSSYMDHPVQLEMRRWSMPPPHVHHMTADLCGFLGAVVASLRSALAKARVFVPLTGAMGPFRGCELSRFCGSRLPAFAQR